MSPKNELLASSWLLEVSRVCSCQKLLDFNKNLIDIFTLLVNSKTMTFIRLRVVK